MITPRVVGLVMGVGGVRSWDRTLACPLVLSGLAWLPTSMARSW